MQKVLVSILLYSLCNTVRVVKVTSHRMSNVFIAKILDPKCTKYGLKYNPKEEGTLAWENVLM